MNYLNEKENSLPFLVFTDLVSKIVDENNIF
jgi:hypothetical protein